MKVDPHLVADPHWRALAAALHEAHARRVDVPDAISVALEDGPLNPDAPATDLASRIERVTEPEPFTVDPTGEVDSTHRAGYHHSGPHRPRTGIGW